MDALRSAPGLPLGLLCVAASLRTRYEVDILDARLEHDLENKLPSLLDEEILFVGITAHTGPMISEALKISRVVKSVSDVPVVWGGVHASLAPKQTLTDPNVDICVIGEGERTALELANALEYEFSLDSVKGVAYRKNGDSVLTEPRELLPPSQWGSLAYGLVDVSKYLPLYDGRPSLFFQASRGCPYRCAYCYNAPFNRRKYRKSEPETVIESLRQLKRTTPFSDVYFVDDNFFVDLKWALQVAKGIQKLGLTWQVQGVDVEALLKMDVDYIRALRESGCRRLTIGVETASDCIRKMIHKRGSKEDVIRAIGKLEGSGINVFASFMVGFPTETIEQMKQTVDLAFELLDRYEFLRVSPFYCYTPFPGTEAYAAALAEGFEPPAQLSDWAKIGGFDDFTWERQSEGRRFDKAFFEGLNMATLFMDQKAQDYSDSKLIRFVADLYRPVARFRARRMFFSLMPEKIFLRRITAKAE